MGREGDAQWISYLRLLRIPNVFTAVADVTMGFLFVRQTLQPAGVLGLLVASSALMYSAGMVLNDLWDIERDRSERPRRPLPSGTIPIKIARRLGLALLALGLLSGWTAGVWGSIPGAMVWRAGLVVTLLAAAIVLYDGVLKRTFAGPVFMGLCRFLNVLLGMSVAAISGESNVCLGFEIHQLLAATGIGIYVVGITWFARTEARVSSRVQLILATVVMMSGIGCLGLICRWLPDDFARTLTNDNAWLTLLGLIAFTIVRQAAKAVADPQPQRVQQVVKHSILSLIVLDASVALLVSPPVFAVLVLFLLVPTLVLGRWIEST